MPRSSVCMKTLWKKKMNKRCKLPKPNSFQAIYTNKYGNRVVVTALSAGFNPTWTINDDLKQQLIWHGIIPKELDD